MKRQDRLYGGIAASVAGGVAGTAMVMKRRSKKIKKRIGKRRRPVKNARAIVGPRLKRRIRAASGRPIKRARIIRSRPVAGSEYVRSKHIRGRMRKNSQRSMMKLSLAYRIMRWQNMVPYERGSSTLFGTAGALPLSFKVTTAAPTVSCELPCYVFCLNASNVSTLAGVVGAYRLQFSTASGSFAFSTNALGGALNDYSGYAADGVTRVNTYQLEKANTGSFPTGRYIQNNWYDIRMMLYNATAQPTVFDVSIIQFDAETHDPVRLQSSPTDTATEIQDRNACYEKLIRPYVSHPCVPQHKQKRGWRTLTRRIITMQPNSTTDVDTSPNTRELRLFYRDGQINDYMWQGDISNSNDPAQNAYRVFGNPMVYDVEQPGSLDIHAHPHPRARKYLLVRCMDHTITGSTLAGALPTSMTSVVDASDGVTNAPSFDICIRKSETYTAS